MLYVLCKLWCWVELLSIDLFKLWNSTSREISLLHGVQLPVGDYNKSEDNTVVSTLIGVVVNGSSRLMN